MLRFTVAVSSLFLVGACGSSGPMGSGGSGGGACPNIPLSTVPMPDTLVASGQRNLVAVDDTRLYSLVFGNQVLSVLKQGGAEVSIGEGYLYESLAAGSADLFISTLDDVILRLAKDGSSQTPIAFQQSGASSTSQAIAADGEHVYWLGEGPLPVIAGAPTMGFLRRSDPDGGNLIDVATGLRAPTSLFVDGGLLIWAEQGSSGFDSSAPPDGTIRALFPGSGGPPRTLASGLVGAVVRGHRDGFVWYGAGADLYRVADTGGAPELMIRGGSQAAVGATAVYWLENVSSGQHTLLLRTPIAGGCPTPLMLVDGANGPLVVDDASVYVMIPNGVVAVKQ